MDDLLRCCCWHQQVAHHLCIRFAFPEVAALLGRLLGVDWLLGEEAGPEDNGFFAGSNRQEHWWPKHAKHNADDFKRYFNRSQKCTLAYTFVDTADKSMPPSDYPDF
eukprot:gene13439-13566_t